MEGKIVSAFFVVILLIILIISIGCRKEVAKPKDKGIKPSYYSIDDLKI